MREIQKMRWLSVFLLITFILFLFALLLPTITVSAQLLEISVLQDTDPTGTPEPSEPCSACEVFDMQNFSVTLTAIAVNKSPTPSPDTSNDIVPQRGSVYYIAGFLILMSFLWWMYRLWKSR